MCECLKVYELKELYEKHRPSQISFTTEDQEWYDSFDSMSLTLVFPDIIIVKNPALIYLTDGKSQLCLNQIQQIKRQRLAGDSGDILTVVSLDRYGRRISYEFLVS